MIDYTQMKSEMYDVVGAIHEVHRELGAGLNEYCYQEGLQIQLSEQNIPFVREMSFHPTYHGRVMSAEYRVDFVCKDSIVVECKAVSELLTSHRAQLFNYIRLLKKPCGILVNFFPKFATIERYLYDAVRGEVLSISGEVLQQYNK